MVFLQGVTSEFLHVWLSVHRIKESELSLESGGLNSGKGGNNRLIIRNASIARRIKTDYDTFLAQNTDLETFFDRSVITFKQSNTAANFTTRVERATKTPVFIFKKRSSFCLKPDNQLKAWKPIEMPLKAIFAIYDIHHDFRNSTIDECLALQEPNNVDVNFYLLDGNKAYWTKSLPGFRQSGNRIIKIGVHDNRFFWLATSNLITERHYCQKLPGKCLYWAERKEDVKTHEVNCSDQSNILAKQVNFVVLNHDMTNVIGALR